MALTMNFLFIWTGVPSYMVACWRELADKPGVNVKLLLEINKGDESVAEDMLQGLDYSFCYKGQDIKQESVRASIVAFKPDLFVVVGWRAKISRFVTLDKAFDNIPKLLAFDMIFEFKLKKFLAPLLLRSYLKRFCGAFVPGDRTTFYSKFLGFSSTNIHRGLFGIDAKRFAEAYEMRSQRDEYPRIFVFVGRYAKEKRLDVLVTAYKIYRTKVDNPWKLSCYGQGEDSDLLSGTEGVTDYGFTKPGDMVDVYANNGAFVLTSEYDPWPLVIAESVASGLPVVCTEACGSHADLVRSHYNGVVCGTNDAESIANGMVWVHENEKNLLEFGRKGMALVAPYSKEQWAEYFLAISKKYVQTSRRMGLV